MKIAITGAAGLLGQNLIVRLKARGHRDIVAIDKHPTNTRTLRELHPDVTVIEADLAEPGAWGDAISAADCVVIAHAQISGLSVDPFERNNVAATRNLLNVLAARPERHVVHISSSVVNSAAVDFYTESKKDQEALVRAALPDCVILRPTLMFGWFDRKHLGWLARFMRKSPIFPVPGSGRFLRQPLYVGDFCEIILACIERRESGRTYDITGLERIDYIDLVRLLRQASGARTPIVRIPYGLFAALLRLYALVDRNPPFTVEQLEALVTPDVFDVIDWPGQFGVTPTPLLAAMEETFLHPVYSTVSLEF
jgi:nucleoside-diphosphate-sugar epimerase